MKKMLYILSLVVFTSYFSASSAQTNHNIALRFAASCSGLTTYSPYTNITEGTTYTLADWTLTGIYAQVQPIYDAIKGSSFVIESGALNEDIRIEWYLYNVDCTNGHYLPNGPLTETVFNGYFVVYHNDNGTWTPVEPYPFSNGKKAIISIKNSTGFQTLLTGITGGALELGFSFYNKSTHTCDLTGLSLEFPSPLTDTTKFWVVSAAHFSNIVGGNKNQIAGIDDRISNVPSAFGLKQNYPNPFNPSTMIEYSLPQKSNVELNVYNILGVKVATLINSSKEAGTYKVEFNASELSSGLYIYELKTNKATISHKMLLLK